MIMAARTPDDQVALVAFFSRKTGIPPAEFLKEPFQGFGVIQRGKVVGVVLFRTFRVTSIEIAWAGDPGWVSRRVLRTIFRYVFTQLKVLRVWGIIRHSNAPSRELARRVGFTEVGELPHEFGVGDSGYLYQMAFDQCRWLETTERQR